MFDKLIAILGDAGVSAVSLVFGAIGAALGIAYSPTMSRREMFAALLAGLVCAAIGPEVVRHWWAMPPFVANGLSFVFGIGGMFIVPGFLAFWRGFAIDPFAWLDRIRGAQKPPQPPGGQS